MTTHHTLTDDQQRALRTLARVDRRTSAITDPYCRGREDARTRLRFMLAHDDHAHRIRLWIERHPGGTDSEDHLRGYASVQYQADRILKGNPNAIRELLGDQAGADAAAPAPTKLNRKAIDARLAEALHDHELIHTPGLAGPLDDAAFGRMIRVHIPALGEVIEQLLDRVDELEAEAAAVAEACAKWDRDHAELVGYARVLRDTLRDVLAEFVHKTHPGEICLQSRHVGIGQVEAWRAVLADPTPTRSKTPAEPDPQPHP